MAIIEASGLRKEFEYVTREPGFKGAISGFFRRRHQVRVAVDNVSLKVNEGEIIAFLGPNGAGKTTTLKMLSGILHPTTGSAKVMGFVPWQRDIRFRKRFSIVLGQKSQLWWDLPARESFELHRCMYEVPLAQYRQTTRTLADMLNVTPQLDLQVRRLSLGERMKMELIAALLHQPQVIFLDEPTIGLDLTSQRQIREFIRTYCQQQGATIILTSHYVNDIEQLCERTVVVNQGRVVFDDKTIEIQRAVGNRKYLSLRFSVPVDESKLSRLGVVKTRAALEATLDVDAQQAGAAVQKALATLPVVDINLIDVPLEDAIEALYRRTVRHG